MQVLHLHWLTPTQPEQHGRFFLWAETAAAPNPAVTGAKNQPSPTHLPSTHLSCAVYSK